MKEKFKLLHKDYVCRIFTVLAIFLTFGMTVSIFWVLGRLPEEVPLFYSLHWGKQQLAASPFLFIIPFSSLAILTVNTLIAVFVFGGDYFWGKILSVFSFLVSFISFYALTNIIFLFL